MSIKSKSLHILGSVLLTMSLVAGTFADTVKLKDGSIIKGKIVRFDNGTFVVAIGEGSRRREMTFAASEIASIMFDAPQTNTSNRTASYTEPAPAPVKVVTSDDNAEPAKPQPQSQTANTGGKMKPIAWSINVLADNTANGWTNTGWVVKKGQRIHITSDGKVSLGKGKSTTASGDAQMNDDQKLLKNVPTGALIAVIGDDNNDFIYIGAEREFTATRDGALFLGINEGNLDDNSGAFNVKVEIIPDGV
jgi:hypothetical protein